MDTDSWLAELGLEKYAETFRDNHLDWDSLPFLEEADLRELGVDSLGHRKKLLRAIAALQVDGQVDSRAPGDSERRQVSVAFFDLVGSTELSTRIDAEEMDAVIRRYQETVTPIVDKYGGYVARFSGDGILCYFGYPNAVEHEAELAVRAGLEACRQVSRVEFHPGVQSMVRVGIATGDVVVGGVFDKGTHYEAMVTGETPNLAARLQGAAQPGTVAICDSTRALAGELFSFVDAGQRELKGFERPVQCWTVAGESASQDRFRARYAAGASDQLSGRQAELDALHEGWDRAKAGNGSSVLVLGEAGLGKSRLLNAFCAGLDENEALQVRLYCSPYTRSSPLYPIINFLNNAIGIDPEESAGLRAEKLMRFLDASYPQPGKVYPFLCRLLGIEDTEVERALAGLSPQRIRDETLACGVAMLTHGANERPILIFVEDVHWSDPTTAQFLERLTSAISDLRSMLVMTSRPDGAPEWPTADLTRLWLQRLDGEHLLSIIRNHLGDRRLPEEILRRVLDRSDGVPLFAEEISRSLAAQFDSGEDVVLASGDMDQLSVPNALQSGLIMRLDRLGQSREFVLTSAVLGREFSLDLVAAVNGMSVEETTQVIEKLCDEEIFQRLPSYQPPRYSFHHALLRDAAYGNLLRSRRREIHLTVAEVLLTQFPQSVANEPERLARHYTSAEHFPQAIDYWLRAGARALAASANLEATHHLERGLELLGRLENPELQIGLELQLLMTLAPALTALKGFAAPEVREVLNRARELCELLGASEQLFPVMRGLMSFYTVQADYKVAIAMGEELGAVLSRESDPGHQLELAWVLGSAHLFRGEVSRSLPLFERSIELYRPERHRSHTLVYGQDPGVAALSHYALTLNLQGRYRDGIDVERRILEGLEELNHPFTRAQALAFLQSIYYMRGELERLETLASENVGFCEEQGFPVFMGMSMVYKGWCLAMRGDASGPVMTRSGIDLYELSGAQTSKHGFLAALVTGLLHNGDLEQASAVLQKASEEAERSGEVLFRPALSHSRAELLLRNGDPLAVEPGILELRQSINKSETSGSRHYELVCRSALVRLLTFAGEDPATELGELERLCVDMRDQAEFKSVREALGTLQAAGR